MYSRLVTGITDWFRTTTGIATGRSTAKRSMQQRRYSLLGISAAMASVAGTGLLILLAYGARPTVVVPLLALATCVLLLDAVALSREDSRL